MSPSTSKAEALTTSTSTVDGGNFEDCKSIFLKALKSHFHSYTVASVQGYKWVKDSPRCPKHTLPQRSVASVSSLWSCDLAAGTTGWTV